MHSLLLLLLAGLQFSLASAGIKAIIPVSAGQIGITPVTLTDLPPAPSFVGKIGVNTQYLTDLGANSTSWIGPNPSYIGSATPTSGASITVATDAAGGVSVLTGPALRKALLDIANDVPLCGAAKVKARQVQLCDFNNFLDTVAANGPIQEVNEINAAMGAGRLVIPAADIAQLIANFQAAAAVAAPATLTAGAVGILYLLWEQFKSDATMPPVISAPASVTGSTTSTASATQTSAACSSPTAFPICSDGRCEGNDGSTNENPICTTGDFQNCECLINSTDYTQEMDPTWLTAFINITEIPYPLEDPLASTTTAAAPTSSVATAVLGVATCSDNSGDRAARDDIANSAATWCSSIISQKLWTQGAISMKFANVKTYTATTLSAPTDDGDDGISFTLTTNQRYCPAGQNVADFFGAMTADTCTSQFLIGIDGCAPFSAPSSGPFLKWGGLSLASCAIWQATV